MAVSYQFTEADILGLPGLTTSGDTTQRIELGTIAKGTDKSTNAYGEAEFIYVKFTGTVVAGDFVLVDRFAKTAVQSPTSATKGNYGLSMAAQTSGSYGWVMIRGVHDGANVVTGQTAGTLLTGTATAGRASSGTANYVLDGTLLKNTASANVGTVELYWPVCSGR